MVMLSLPRIFDDAPVACLTPLSLCMTESVVLVNPGGDQSGVAWFTSQGDSRAKWNLTEPIPLWAFEFVMECICLYGPSLRIMKTSAHWCCVHMSYFTHNWETGGGQECLIPSRTGPKSCTLPPSRQVSCHHHTPLWLWNMHHSCWFWKTDLVFQSQVLVETFLHLLLEAWDKWLDVEED